MRKFVASLFAVTLAVSIGAGIYMGLRGRSASAAPLVSAASAPAKVAHTRKRSPRKVRKVAHAPEVCTCDDAPRETSQDIVTRLLMESRASDPAASVESVSFDREIVTRTGERVRVQVTLAPAYVSSVPTPLTAHGGPLARRGTTVTD